MGIEQVRQMLQLAGVRGVTVTSEPDPLPAEPKRGDIHHYLDGAWMMWDGTQWFQVGHMHKAPYVVHGSFDEHGKQIPGTCNCEVCSPRGDRPA